MVMKRELKEREVANLEDRFNRARSLILSDFRGLTSNEMVHLREQITKKEMEYKVIKNTLARIAAARSGVDIEDWLEGPTGICFGYGDPVIPFKISDKLNEDFERFELKGGIFEQDRVEIAEISKYAKIPSRDELLIQLVYVTRGPIQKLAVSLKAISRNLVVVLNEVCKEKKMGGNEK